MNSPAIHLQKITLLRFRCHQAAEFVFEPGINVICGANAQGKTSILEAVYFLMTGRSFRTPNISDLIQMGSDQGFHLETHFLKYQVQQRLKASVHAKERYLMHNNTPCTSSAHLLGILQGVLLTPDDIQIVKGGPGFRRQFLDTQIAQVDPLYIHHFFRFQRALRQRNALLRMQKTESIQSWEQELAQSAAYIVQQRRLTLQELENHGRAAYHFLSNEKALLTLVYAGQAPLDITGKALLDHYIQQYAQNRSREIKVGYTLVGPHKDDINILLDQRDLRYHASEGEQRSGIVALRLAEWTRMQKIAQLNPLLMIDDIGVSLDDFRQKRLFEHIQRAGQVILTTTQMSGFPSHFHVERMKVEGKAEG